MTSRNDQPNGTAVIPESSNSVRGRAILRVWLLSNGSMLSTSLRKNRKKKRRNAKSQRQNRSRLNPSRPFKKRQRPKLPLRDTRNLPRHRPKNRRRKNGVGSDESQTTAKISCCGVRAVLAPRGCCP